MTATVWGLVVLVVVLAAIGYAVRRGIRARVEAERERDALAAARRRDAAAAQRIADVRRAEGEGRDEADAIRRQAEAGDVPGAVDRLRDPDGGVRRVREPPP